MNGTECWMCHDRKYVDLDKSHKEVPGIVRLPCPECNSIHVDRESSLADHIISNWNDWVAEAGQAGQVEQSEKAAHVVLRNCIVAAIRTYYAILL